MPVSRYGTPAKPALRSDLACQWTQMIDPVLHADQALISREVAALARTTARRLFTTAGTALSLSDLLKNEQAQATRLPA